VSGDHPDVDVLTRAAEEAERPGAALTPSAARALAAVFRRWAWMGRLDPAQLHRIAGPETIALARHVLGETT
jgi:hypothetical protein